MMLALFVGGLIALVAGAELFVGGAARIAARFGISPLIIGLTVVAFGTSAPEVAVSIQSALAGQGDLALGNVVGSNIFNVLFILGVSACITPLIVARQLIWLDVPIMIGVSLLLWVVSLDGRISRGDGVLFLVLMAAYTVFLGWQSRREPAEPAATRPKGGSLGDLLLILGGMVGLIVGARWLVQSAVTIATRLGVDELVIGLTVVAAGTSLPEVAASVVASIRGQRDIAVGNVVGSNIFNVLLVLGASSLVAGGIAVPSSVLRFDFPIMLAVAVACLPIFFTGHIIARWEGGLFLGYYLVYAIYLILDATGHQALPAFSAVTLGFVVPLTVLTLGVVLIREFRNRNQAAGYR
jgi:cation:H+ antiporter